MKTAPAPPAELWGVKDTGTIVGGERRAEFFVPSANYKGVPVEAALHQSFIFRIIRFVSQRGSAAWQVHVQHTVECARNDGLLCTCSPELSYMRVK